VRIKSKRPLGSLAWALCLVLPACSDTWGVSDVPVCGSPSSAPANVAVEYLVAPVAASASSTDPETSPAEVYDYDAAQPSWNSGASAPQWILLDLGSPRTVTRASLQVAQALDGATSHRILGGLTPVALDSLAGWTGMTSDGQILSLNIAPSVPTPVRYLKIETSASPSPVAWGEIKVWATASRMPTYFGYYADGSSWPSVTPGVCQHINLSWVGIDSLGHMPILIANLAYAHFQKLRVSLMVPPDVFFKADMSLADHHVDNWNRFARQVSLYIDDVAFIYPIDEPYSVSKLAGMSAAEMKATLETVSSVIKSTFPSVPLAFSFSAIDFDTQESAFADLANPFPASYEYFGFDCYGSWDQCGEPSFRAVHSIPWYVSQMRAKLNGNQRIFLFPDAFIRKASPADSAGDAAEAARRLTRADQYYQLALSDSSIVGLFAYIYQDHDYEGASYFGVSHWPALQARYREIGQTITGK